MVWLVRPDPLNDGRHCAPFHIYSSLCSLLLDTGLEFSQELKQVCAERMVGWGASFPVNAASRERWPLNKSLTDWPHWPVCHLSLCFLTRDCFRHCDLPRRSLFATLSAAAFCRAVLMRRSFLLSLLSASLPPALLSFLHTLFPLIICLASLSLWGSISLSSSPDLLCHCRSLTYVSLVTVRWAFY